MESWVPDILLWSRFLDSVRNELVKCCPGPNNDMPGGMKWLEHAIRRGNFFGALVLLQRGADRNATLADGTPLVDFALENDQDEIAVLLLEPRLMTGTSVRYIVHYRHEVLAGFTSGQDSHEPQGSTVLRRLKFAAEAMI